MGSKSGFPRRGLDENNFLSSVNSNPSISGDTIYSGSTDLSLLFGSGSIDVTRVGNGVNSFTGGTDNIPTVNITGLTVDNITVSGDSQVNSFSAITISAATIYSGSTDLSLLFGNGAVDITRIGNGVNTFTGGTENLPTVNITGASLDNLYVSGSNSANSFSASTISATTFYSGSTDLSLLLGGGGSSNSFVNAITEYSANTFGFGGSIIQDTSLELNSYDLDFKTGSNDLLTLKNDGSFSLGYLASGSSSSAVSVGESANASGVRPTAVGYQSDAIGDYSIAIGSEASSTETDSISIGRLSKSASGCVSIGYNAGNTSGAKNNYAISIGHLSNNGSNDIGLDSVAIGYQSKTRSNYSVSLGYLAEATGVTSVSIGGASNAKGERGISVGGFSQSDGNDSVSVGYNSIASGLESIAIGRSAKAENLGVVTIGKNAGNTTGTKGSVTVSMGYNSNQGTTDIGNNSVAVGSTTTSSGGESVCIGYLSQATTTSSVAVGHNVDSSGLYSISLGRSSVASGQYSLSIGNVATSEVLGAIAVGYNAGNTTGTKGNSSVSIGYQSNDGSVNIGSNSVAIGTQSEAKDANAVAIGNQSESDANGAISLGYRAGGGNVTTFGASSITIGSATNYNAATIGANSVTIGPGASSSGSTALAIGSTSRSDGSGSIAIGSSSFASGNGSIAIGDATVDSTNAVSIGTQSAARAQAQVCIGYRAGGGTTGTSGINTISIGNNVNYNQALGARSITMGDSVDNLLSDSFALGWAEDVPRVLFAKTEDQYINGTGALVIHGLTATTSSVGLDLKSTTRVFKTNVVDTTEEGALTATAGMIVFNSTTSKFRGYDGSTWVDFH